MFELVWFVVNGVIGVPIALILLVLLREVVRAVLALGLGFRVFELKWGFGRRVFQRSLGPVVWVLAPWPWAASIVAESGSPIHHRLARLIQAAGPLSIQVAVAIGLHGAGARPLASVLQRFDPVASLWIANGVLIVLHALLPVTSRSGDRTDVRAVLDVVFAGAEASRRARALYYARLACRWLERGDLSGARSVLERGLTQLGREPLIIDCQARVLERSPTSRGEQRACAAALRRRIAEDAAAHPVDRRDGRAGARVRRAAISAIPLTLAAVAWLAFEADSVLRFTHDRLVSSSAAIAREADAEACAARLVGWSRWMPVIDLALGADPERLRDRHEQLARLERCRGRLEAAAAHLRFATEAAENAIIAFERESASDPSPRIERESASDPSPRIERESASDPSSRIERELRLAEILRERAAVEAERRRFQVALATLGRAESRIDLAKRFWPRLAGEADPETGADPLDGEIGRIALARGEVLARMRGGESAGPVLPR